MSLQLAAQHLASKGRGEDKMLVHMTPREVAGLHALAMAHGGQLTTNPETGLPEAGFLSSILPMIAGMALNFVAPGLGAAIGGAFGLSGAVGTGMLVGGITGLASGSLQKGLMAGLGAYGGAGLAEGLSGMGAGAAQTAAMTPEAIARMTAPDALGTQISEQAAKNVLAEQATKDFLAKPLSEQIGAGLGAFKEAPLEGLKTLARPALAAAAPIMADQMVPTITKPPAPIPGYIRPFTYDPYGQRYTPQTPVLASEWGTRNLVEAPVRAASGGAVALADGGTANDAYIQDLYQNVLGRAADPGGLQYWEQQMSGGATPNQVIDAMKASPEFQARAASTGYAPPPGVAETISPQAMITGPHLGDETYLKSLYQEVLGRQADPTGLQYYENAMRAAGATPADIRASMMLSPEYAGLQAARAAQTAQAPQPTIAPPSGISYGQPAIAQPPAPKTMGELVGAYVQGGGATRMPSIADIQPTERTYSQNEVHTLLNNYLASNPNAQYQDVLSFGTAKGIPLQQLTSAYNEVRFSGFGGGSQQAYDYLMGRGAYPTVPYTPTGEVMKPYAESVLGIPADASTKQWLFNPQTRKYERNPAYVAQATTTGLFTDPKNKPTIDPGAGMEWAWDDANKQWLKKPTTSTDTGGAKAGGLMAMADGGMPKIAKLGILGAAAEGGHLGGYSDGGRLLRGPGDGVSDSIPATIGGKQPARLADGEFVVPARIVSEIGNGSTEAGARKLYAMMDRVQRARKKTTGKDRVAADTKADQYLPA